MDTGQWLLFDNEKDPLQLDDRIGDPALQCERPVIPATRRPSANLLTSVATHDGVADVSCGNACDDDVIVAAAEAVGLVLR